MFDCVSDTFPTIPYAGNVQTVKDIPDSTIHILHDVDNSYSTPICAISQLMLFVTGTSDYQSEVLYDAVNAYYDDGITDISSLWDNIRALKQSYTSRGLQFARVHSQDVCSLLSQGTLVIGLLDRSYADTYTGARVGLDERSTCNGTAVCVYGYDKQSGNVHVRVYGEEDDPKEILIPTSSLETSISCLWTIPRKKKFTKPRLMIHSGK